jgi:hypothetical protein
LRQDVQKNIGKALKDRPTGKGAELGLNLQVAAKLAEQATAIPLTADPPSLWLAVCFVRIASESKTSADADIAQQAVSQIINYRSSLSVFQQVNISML